MRRLLRQILLLPAAALLATLGVATAQAAPAHAAQQCGPTSLVDGVAVERWPDDEAYGVAGGGVKIVVSPSVAARTAPLGTNDVWHVVQACVPGLTGTVADSIYWQLDCHIAGGAVYGGSDGASRGVITGPEFRTGQSWDLETWQPVMGRDFGRYFSTACESSDDGDIPPGEWEVYFGVDPLEKSEQDVDRLQAEAEQRREAEAAANSAPATPTGTVSMTNGEGLFAHTDQWVLDKVELLAEGTAVTVLCETGGPEIVDYATSDRWDRVRLADGRELYVSSLFIDTGGATTPAC